MKRILLFFSMAAGLTMACQRTEIAPEGTAEPTICPPPPSCIDSTRIRKDVGCTAQYEPVCGCNAKTYSNPCEATNAGVQFFTKGPCPTKNN
jgi:hypothetical protein